MTSLRFKDIPFELQATDIKKHILNVDSRFREPGSGGSSADFQFRLLSPVKNVLRIRITSIEMPNNYYNFSSKRRNVVLRIFYGEGLASSAVIKIPSGNYSAFDMVDAVNTALVAKGLPWLSVYYNLVTSAFTFTGNRVFALDTALLTTPPSSLTWPRTHDYGLGYNMGFSYGIFDSGAPDASGNRTVTSDQLPNFAGDTYVFLKVNDFDCVRQTVGDSDFTALAKIVVREPKNYMSFDDYAGQHAKEVVFKTPQDLSRLRVQLLDPYGEILQMGSTHISFSIEVLEIMNLSLYNTVRDAFAVGWKV
jgi:hypothetical protein